MPCQALAHHAAVALPMTPGLHIARSAAVIEYLPESDDMQIASARASGCQRRQSVANCVNRPESPGVKANQQRPLSGNLTEAATGRFWRVSAS